MTRSERPTRIRRRPADGRGGRQTAAAEIREATSVHGLMVGRQLSVRDAVIVAVLVVLSVVVYAVLAGIRRRRDRPAPDGIGGQPAPGSGRRRAGEQARRPGLHVGAVTIGVAAPGPVAVRAAVDVAQAVTTTPAEPGGAR